MIFRSQKKGTVVWDGKKNRRLCQFKNHIFKTEDDCIIKQLIARGYEHEGETQPKPEEFFTSDSTANLMDMRVTELKKLAKEQGVKGYQRMKKAELVEVIK